MSNRFDQFDRAVHRVNLPLFDPDVASLLAVGASDFGRLLSRHFAGPVRLNHAAKSLANFMRRAFDLVVMRRPRPLLDGLDLAGNIGCPFENFRQISFESCLFRVHAIPPES
jgi:hypothetical protein